MLYALIIFACFVGPDYTGPARTPTSRRWPPDPIPQPAVRELEFRVNITVEIGDMYSEQVEAFPAFEAFVKCLGGPARDLRSRMQQTLFPPPVPENGYCWEAPFGDRYQRSYACVCMDPACMVFDADGDGDIDMYDFALWTRHTSSGGRYSIYRGVPMWRVRR